MDADPLPRLSERTALRRLGVSDLADFQAYRRDPEVARYQGWQIESDAEARSFLLDMTTAALLRPGHWCQLGIADGTNDTLIGDVGLFVSAEQDQAEIGFSLNRRVQGQGLAGEAVRQAIGLVFECSPVSRIVGITDARNLPSIRLLKRVGMRKVGEHEAMFRDEPCIEYTFAISRGDGVDPA